MVNRILIIIVIIFVLAVGGVGAATWIIAVPDNDRETGSSFLGSTRTYDTTGGQELRPKW